MRGDSIRGRQRLLKAYASASWMALREIPAGKDPHAVDAKLIGRYGLDLSRWSRARRQRQGEASVKHLRYRRFFVLLATTGMPPCFEHEPDSRDIRERPIYFAGYSIGWRPGHGGRSHDGWLDAPELATYDQAMLTDGFPATMWTLVLQAAGRGDRERARAAFQQLCVLYRDAIVGYMRARGLSKHDAEDAAHEFLEIWLRRGSALEGFERGGQRFRQFLCVCLGRFLKDRHTRLNAARRGGGAEHEPLDGELPGDHGDSTAGACDLAFALSIQRTALLQLRSQWADRVAAGGYERLRCIALGEVENPGYPLIAAELGVPIGTVKSWVYGLRREYFAAVREAVLPTVPREELDAEVLHLFGLFSAPTRSGGHSSRGIEQPPTPELR